MDNTQLIQELQPGTSLYGGKYIVEKKIGEGGFGITYKAVQRDLNRAVCIKEFFLSGRCVRNSQARSLHLLNISEGDFEKYRMAFVKEARTLASLHHPNIVEVIDIFNEGNTSYMVMPFVEGRSLQSIIEKNGPLTYPEAVNYIAQIANAVGYIHDHHILHRDIKPDNIMITDDYRAVLIDFGSAREFVEDKTQSHTSILTHGFAPPEQYSRTSRKGSYTDIYAIGATLYFILTGRTPVDAAARLTESLPEPQTLKPDLPEEANSTIMKAMQLNPQNRYQSIAEFMADLCKEVAPRSSKKKTASKRNSVISPANTLKTANTTQPSQKKKKSTIAIWTGVIVLIILTVGAYVLFSAQQRDYRDFSTVVALSEDSSLDNSLKEQRMSEISPEDLQDSINRWVVQVKALKQQEKAFVATQDKKKCNELQMTIDSIQHKIVLAIKVRDEQKDKTFNQKKTKTEKKEVIDDPRQNEYDGAVVFFIQNPNDLTDEEKANLIPSCWIYYEEDELKVNKKQMKTVDYVARRMNNLPEDYKCVVVGISNYFGSDAYVMEMSEKRAHEVGVILREKYGLSSNRIIVDYKGKNCTFGLDFRKN